MCNKLFSTSSLPSLDTLCLDHVCWSNVALAWPVCTFGIGGRSCARGWMCARVAELVGSYIQRRKTLSFQHLRSQLTLSSFYFSRRSPFHVSCSHHVRKLEASIPGTLVWMCSFGTWSNLSFNLPHSALANPTYPFQL